MKQAPWRLLYPQYDAKIAISFVVHCVPRYPSTFIHLCDSVTNNILCLNVLNLAQHYYKPKWGLWPCPQPTPWWPNGSSGDLSSAGGLIPTYYLSPQMDSFPIRLLDSSQIESSMTPSPHPTSYQTSPAPLIPLAALPNFHSSPIQPQPPQATLPSAFLFTPPNIPLAASNFYLSLNEQTAHVLKHTNCWAYHKGTSQLPGHTAVCPADLKETFTRAHSILYQTKCQATSPNLNGNSSPGLPFKILTAAIKNGSL